MTFQAYLEQAFSIKNLQDLTPEMIADLSLKGLVLDFDGVLGGVRAPYATPDLCLWLKERLQDGLNIAIHSNNPESVGKERRERFLHQFPEILWMPTHPKKPSPSTLQYLQARWKCQPHEIAMVDDRLLTGGLAAFRAGVCFIFVAEAVADYSLAPVLETGFAALRLWEKLRYRAPNKNWCTRGDSNL